ncbi:GAF domain-containing protein [Pseudonocardiaceae bacterium YIM PH 21723]|nr:GAF domain-containing protein [Pseudonocardiaceae bacterium YIM PH 21723]
MDAKTASRTLAASTEITTQALFGDDPDLVLPMVVREAAALAEADLGVVMVRGEDNRLTVEAAYRNPGLADPGTDPVGAVLSDRSAAARVARSGVPMTVDDLCSDPRTAPFVPPPLRIYGPFAVAPFGTASRRLGALAVYRRRGAPVFTAAGVEVLTWFAAQAGLALVLAEGATARRRLALYEERERIARDLHDVIIQRLYASGVQLELLSRRLGSRLEESDAARLTEAVDQVDQTIAEVRATVRALRRADPATRSDAPHLLDSIRAEADLASELLGFTVQLETTGDLRQIPTEPADHARAALREALSNVVRHSGAHSVLVRARHIADRLTIQVIDDGCGIPRDVTRRGLANIEERAVMSGGRCVVQSSPRAGTTLTWEVPAR